VRDELLGEGRMRALSLHSSRISFLLKE